MKTLALALLTTFALAGAVQAQSMFMERPSALPGQARFTAMPSAEGGPAVRRPGQGTSQDTTSTSAPVVGVWEHRLHSANQ